MMTRVALITGAAKNTGFAIARRFAAEGLDVCLTSRDEASASAAAARIQQEFPAVRAIGLKMEQGDIGEIDAAFARIEEAFGRLDIYVANAADLAVGCDIYNTTAARWDEVMNVNVRGTFLCCQHAQRLMREGGSIVFISSVHADASIVGRVAYSTSKAALSGMMRSLALELANRGVRVNSIIAGAIWSDRWEKQTPEQTAQRRLKYPAGRESSTDEIAHAVSFLCAPQSATITGTELTVDSGISICLLPYDREWNKA